MILIEKMTSEEFDKYSALSFENYISALAVSSGKEKDILRIEMRHVVPPVPADNDLWLILKNEDQEVGFIWLQVRPEKKEAFGFDIFLWEKFRSQRFGREVMQRSGKLLHGYDVETVKICVFEENKIARNLYASLGFRETSYHESSKQFTLEITLV